MKLQGPAKKSSSTNAFHNSNQRNNNCINFNDLEFSKIKDRTNVQNSTNPLIKNLVKNLTNQIV
jgi:hypothetical protein